MRITVSMHSSVKVCCCPFRFITFILNFIKLKKPPKSKGRKKMNRGLHLFIEINEITFFGFLLFVYFRPLFL